MKHLPTELLYLLKVYNYIKFDIGLDHARSRADDIRAFIAKADYLKDYPTILEYLSEDKSMEDIITTRRMATALDAVGITLEDHIVVTDRDYVSIRQSNLYDPEQCRMMV